MHISLLASCLTALAVILPDVIVPGTRRIEVETQLDAQPMIDRCCVQHAVVAGESFARIARERLGEVARMREIADLNPDLDPRRLAIGQRIWLPPKVLPATAKEPLFVYVAQAWPFSENATPFCPSDSLQPPRRFRLSFLLVPASQREAFAAAQQEKDRHAAQAMAAEGKIQVLTVDNPGNHVRDSDPTYKRRDTIVVERDEQGTFSIRVQSVAFDKQGKVIVPKVEANGTGEPGPDKASLWLLMLAGGGGWLLWRRQRGRARQQPASAPA